jgi:glycosyltransferase involved in cell wall biosynthesis
MRPGITLAMIVRDEAAKLERCLSSLSGVADEVHIIDTGSTDETVEIAKSFSAKVRHMPWPGAFDAARNASVAEVETEWVLWLDADEWLETGSAEFIRQAIQNPEAMAFLLVRRDLFAPGIHSEQAMFRLWRHHPELRFAGAIHEHIPLDQLARAFPDKKILPTNIPFWHDGYLPEMSRAKAERNLPLLERASSELPDMLYYDIELAETLKALGKPGAEAIEERIVQKLLLKRDDDFPPENTAALFLMRYLGGLTETDLRTDRTDTLLRMCRGWFGDHPGVRFMAAQTEIRRGDLRKAFDDLLDVERMAETGEYDRLTTSNPTFLREGLSQNLALVAHQLGRWDIARKHYERLLALSPENAIAAENLKLLSR